MNAKADWAAYQAVLIDPVTVWLGGGSGKWAGASGKGVFTRVPSQGEHKLFNFEIELPTP